MPITGGAWLPCLLDFSMLEARGAAIEPSNTPDDALPERTGADVSVELGGRFLLTYLRERDVQRLDEAGIVELQGVTRRIYTTPTPASRG